MSEENNLEFLIDVLDSASDMLYCAADSGAEKDSVGYDTYLALVKVNKATLKLRQLVEERKSV